jgi:hypothetical protein
MRDRIKVIVVRIAFNSFQPILHFLYVSLTHQIYFVFSSRKKKDSDARRDNER